MCTAMFKHLRFRSGNSFEWKTTLSIGKNWMCVITTAAVPHFHATADENANNGENAVPMRQRPQFLVGRMLKLSLFYLYVEPNSYLLEKFPKYDSDSRVNKN